MDKKAKKILFNTYWNNGWIDSQNRSLSNDDFEYAKSKGMMFDPFSITHDECIDQITALIPKIDPNLIAKAFLSSLSSRRLELRSGIASYYIARQIPEHKYTPVVSGQFYKDGKITHTSYVCQVCQNAKYGIIGYKDYSNEDLNVLNFERIKWGGVRHGDILYTLFDLQQFIKENIQEPTADDILIFEKILDIVFRCEPNDSPGKLEAKLKDIIKSSKSERKVLLEILACIEVLKPASFDRSLNGRSDWVYIGHWRGEDGYNVDVVNRLFGKYLSKQYI